MKVRHARQVGRRQIRSLIVEIAVVEHGIARAWIKVLVHGAGLPPEGVVIRRDVRVGTTVNGGHVCFSLCGVSRIVHRAIGRGGCFNHNGSHHAVGRMRANAAIILIGSGGIQCDGPQAHSTRSATVGSQREGLWIAPSITERACRAVDIVKALLILESNGFSGRDREGRRNVVVVSSQDSMVRTGAVLCLTEAIAENCNAKQQKVAHDVQVTVRFS